MSTLETHRLLLRGVKEWQARRRYETHAAESSRQAWERFSVDEQTVRNDYSERYQAGEGEWPGDWILGAENHEICQEYPALRRLLDLKAGIVREHAIEPQRISVPRQLLDNEPHGNGSALLQLLPTRSDVILVVPPLKSSNWSWSKTSDLPIRQLSSDPGFVFLWVGSGNTDGLERGRECLAKWGFRRCEDLIFVKRNHCERGNIDEAAETGLFSAQKEHCLMGIRGTVRRATDSWFVHCNVDVDTHLWDPLSDHEFSSVPSSLYTIIENFCLGTRRVQIFGNPEFDRKGWTMVGERIESEGPFPSVQSAPQSQTETLPLLPFHAEIDSLRPKSPTGKRHFSNGDKNRPRPSMQYQTSFVQPLSHEGYRSSWPPRFQHQFEPREAPYLQNPMAHGP